jgi:trimeric autotransporter adhesin
VNSIGLIGKFATRIAFVLGASHFALFATPSQAQSVTSLSCSPATIIGGSGDTVTCTVTLGAVAPSGGTAVTLTSSLPELATSVPVVTVLAGQTLANFSVGTNARYRAYSLLAFAATITASANSTSRSATINVTAQPRPADFTNPNTAADASPWQGRICGRSAIIQGRGNPEILYNCSLPSDGSFGVCTFQQECSFGCKLGSSSNFTANDFCPNAGPNPIALSRSLVIGGERIPATLVTDEPVGTSLTQGLPGAISNQGEPGAVLGVNWNATTFPHSAITIPQGASSAPFDVATSIVPRVTFVDVVGDWSSNVAGRGGHAWLTLLPPSPAPALPIPTLASFVITDPNPVVGGRSSLGTIETSGATSGTGPTISFTSSHPNIVPAPASFVVPSTTLIGGETRVINWAQVQFPTIAPAVTMAVTLTATDGVRSFNAVLTVDPAAPAPVLAGVSVSPSSVVGGASATGTVTLNTVQSGSTVVALSTPAPSNVASLPASVTVPAGQTSASFTITTAARTAADGTFNMNVFANLAGSPGVSALLLITPGAAPAPTVSALSLSPTSVVGGNTSTGTVTLSAAAPSGGAAVMLTSSDEVQAILSVNPLIVPAGTTSATFSIGTRSTITATTTATISAAFNGSSRSAMLTISPPPPPPAGVALSGFTVSPASVSGGTSSTGTLTLLAAAPSGGVLVSLGSNLPGSASVPASVTVPAGATSASFTVTTFNVAATTVQLSAVLGSVTLFAPITINSPASSVLNSVTVSPTSVAGGNSVTGTVSLAAATPVNATVNLSDNSNATSVPTSVTVAAGNTSASFTITTSSVSASTAVVITATYGSVVQTANLTVNPPSPAPPLLASPANDATPAQPVNFDWNDVATATSYEIQIDDSSTIASPFVANQTVTASQVSIGNLPAQRLWWRVRAQNSAGVWGPFSSTRRFTPQAAGTAAAALSAISVSPTSVVGPASSTATVTLTAVAPSGGAVVTLTSSNTAVAGVPANITIAAGATNASFNVAMAAVTANTSVTLTAAYSGVSRTATLTVTPPPPPASLNTLALNPTSVTGGNSSTGTVTLTSAAPSGGSVVTLSSNSPSATVPASVTVAAGATSATFTTTTTAVTAAATATISAAYAGVTRTAALSINPPGTSVSLTVTASGRSGERLTSSPTGINVAVGSTASANFATGTSITLSVSNGRDAIWSGACSSGGNKARSCTFTINANASVTGNVQ